MLDLTVYLMESFSCEEFVIPTNDLQIYIGRLTGSLPSDVVWYSSY